MEPKGAIKGRYQLSKIARGNNREPAAGELVAGGKAEGEGEGQGGQSDRDDHGGRDARPVLPPEALELDACGRGLRRRRPRRATNGSPGVCLPPRKLLAPRPPRPPCASRILLRDCRPLPPAPPSHSRFQGFPPSHFTRPHPPVLPPATPQGSILIPHHIPGVVSAGGGVCGVFQQTLSNHPMPTSRQAFSSHYKLPRDPPTLRITGTLTPTPGSLAFPGRNSLLDKMCLGRRTGKWNKEEKRTG